MAGGQGNGGIDLDQKQKIKLLTTSFGEHFGQIGLNDTPCLSPFSYRERCNQTP
jgi:hypothetical protein